MLRRRAQCLSEYHAAQNSVESARVKLSAAQTTPGKEGKIPALEQLLGSAEQQADSKRVELAQMSAATRQEFQRSQQEKAHALSSIVRAFIRLQLDHSTRVTSVWQNVLESIKDEPAAS